MKEINEAKFAAEIKKIKRKKVMIVVFTVIAILAVAFFSTPSRYEIMGNVIEIEGIGVAAAIILCAVCFVIEFFAVAVVYIPLSSTMLQECDPERNLVLNDAFNKTKSRDVNLAMDYFYLGYYEKSVISAEKSLNSSIDNIALSALFNKARALFFMEGYEAFYKISDDYEARLLNAKKLNPKNRAMYESINTMLKLMRYVAVGDAEKINELRGLVKSWNTSKATDCFVSYIKGLAAYKVGDTEEAIYNFRCAREIGEKTELADLADNYLTLIRLEND